MTYRNLNVYPFPYINAILLNYLVELEEVDLDFGLTILTNEHVPVITQ